MKNWQTLAIALFTMTFSLTGCGPAELGAASDDPVDECQTDKDCAADERCKPDPEGNMCVPKDDSEDPECTEDDDCESGQFCTDDGVCEMEEEEPECSTDSDCESGEMCNDDGECVEDDTDPECTSDDDCESGQVCTDEICVDEGTDECATDADCASGQVCEDGMCVDDGSSDGRELGIKVSTVGGQKVRAIVCSYELCSNTADPASCNNGFWRQGAEYALDASYAEFSLPLEEGRTESVQCGRMNCDIIVADENDCYTDPETAGDCADFWLAHNPSSPELKGIVELTLDGETYTVDSENIVHVGYGEDASEDPATIFPWKSDDGLTHPDEAGFGFSIPALKSETN